MIITITENTSPVLHQAMIDSKNGGRQAILIHVRAGVETQCCGYQFSGSFLSLIKTDMGVIPFQYGDVIKYDDGAP
jgi:hypothetical protein